MRDWLASLPPLPHSATPERPIFAVKRLNIVDFFVTYM